MVKLTIYAQGVPHQLAVSSDVAREVLRSLKERRPDYLSFGDTIFLTAHISAVIVGGAAHLSGL